jgi:probable HAF family extracellular repeat protein
MNTTAARWTIVAIALTLSVASAANAARRYRLVNLDASIGEQVNPFAINDDGLVALRAFENGRIVSMLYDSRTGAVQRLAPDQSAISALSNNGNSAGQGGFSTVGWFIVDGVSGTVPFPGGTGSGALGVNNQGQVVGINNFAGGFFGFSHAVVYSAKTGELTDLGTLGGTSSFARAINQRGVVAGSADVPGGSLFNPIQHAFRWDGGAMEDLGTLGGSSSIAFAIDAQGRIAGFADVQPGRFPPRHAFLFDRDGMHDLGTLPGRNFSEAMAMNDHGEAVGQSYLDALNNSHAVLFSKGAVIDLNDLAAYDDGFVHQTSAGINNAGAIVGASFNPATFQFRSFLLLPIEDE